jgi:hypothetical protein
MRRPTLPRRDSAFQNSLGMDVGISCEHENRTGFLGDLAEPSGVMSNSIMAQRDLRPIGQHLHSPVQGMAVLTSLAQRVKARRRDRYSASEPELCAPDPRVRAWPSKSRALIVLRLLQCCALSGANGARERLLSPVECSPSDLLTCSRHDGEPAPQPPSLIENRFRPAMSRALTTSSGCRERNHGGGHDLGG